MAKLIDGKKISAQDFQNELPGAAHRGNTQALTAGVDIVHLGADGNAVQTGDFGGEKAAFKSSVRDGDFCFFARNTPVAVCCKLSEF